jgi:hypothetical protein
MRTKTILLFLVLGIGIFGLAAVLCAGPTEQQRQDIQNQINHGNPLRATYEKERQDFMNSYDKWDANKTEANRQAALQQASQMHAAEKPLKANRDSIIAKVDSTFDTNEPPGTDVQYDPECSDYGYTSSECYIRICEPSFTSPDEVASTKIHEFEHQRQKLAGRWGPGNTPQACTFEYHSLEFDAYEAELNADFGKRTTLPFDEKIMIINRKIYHLNAMIEAISAKFEGPKIVKTLRDRVVEKPVTIGNDGDYATIVTGTFDNDMAWTVVPPAFAITLGPGCDTTLTLMIHVPADAHLGIGNEVRCTAAAGGDTARSIFFVNVIPPVDVVTDGDVTGMPMHDVDFSFTVVNETADPGLFEVTFTSTLGWSVHPYYQAVPLGANESREFSGTVTIPVIEPYTTDLIVARATHSLYPLMPDSSWLYVTVDGSEAGVAEEASRIFALLPNAPNPFCASTVVRFSLPSRSPADLRVFDVRGRLVRTLVSSESGELEPGIHTLAWDGRDDSGERVASGMYFTQLAAAGRSATIKTILLR